jgi:hypothetical protein
MHNSSHDPGDENASLTGEAETPPAAEPARQRAGIGWALMAAAVAGAVAVVFLIALLV